MSAAKRPPAPPPALPGFTYVDVLGSGGFADVYLYEQQLPRRRVAVKVMLPDRLASGSAEQFTAEANVMALLSTHPAIVTIYQAGVSDDGRPYLVMEYCSRPNLQVRSRTAAFSVAEALRVGVQVAAAVETAHRAGILHRDIKPANILVTEYNRPALTDFGIATTAESEESSGGMSIPWSPPEAFSEAPGSGVATDVYALGATVYTLLAGRSPFEQPGGRNGGADLIQRIESQPVPPLTRADAPASLQLVLERAMAKRPGDRYESALAFARALQRVQIELAHSVTPIDILDDAPHEDAEDDADGELTRVRGIVSIEPNTNPAAGPTRRRDRDNPWAPETTGTLPAASTSAPADTAEPTLLRGPVSIAPQVDIDTSSTIRRPAKGAPLPAHTLDPTDARTATAPETAAGADETATPRSRRGLWIGLGIAAAVVVVGAVAVGASLLTTAVEPQASPTPSTTAVAQDPFEGVVPPVTALTGRIEGGGAVFTWTNPDPKDGDAYLWYPYTLSGNGDVRKVTETTVSLPVDAGGTTCVAVTLVRKGGSASTETRKCTP
ncbi:Serine/threonine-protein kinase PknK [Microbacterium laevaniformans]|uniref:non-specific serine/threonine protein kinase n=1 Tax=Microbacterium laevaniformans TaxID=36807 RepID=A0A150HIC9_9MICO|nr:serine/threonine-protein kinase [Microbacterium laevaniformans]KXZ61887.1 Serine/threonine-protein kinase PknK [Microbacterium laevaniformans]